MKDIYERIMALTDILKELEGLLVKVDLKNIKFLNFTSNHTTVVNNTLSLNPKDLSPEQLATILKQTSLAGYSIVPKDTKLLTVQEAYETDSFKEDVLYFTNKIPSEDVEVLKAAYILREKLVNNESTGEIKEDIILRHGKRGATISNLFSAEYFTDLIKPLYKECSKNSKLGLEMFKIYYETLIEDFPHAIFVSSRESAEDISTKLISKLEYNHRYGMNTLHVHTVGKNNIKKVKKLLNKISEERSDFQFNVTDDKGHYIRITVMLI